VVPLLLHETRALKENYEARIKALEDKIEALLQR
jgi:hypothetical protein